MAGGGAAKMDNKFLTVNIFNFAKVDKVVGGGTTLINKKWLICLFFYPSPSTEI